MSTALVEQVPDGTLRGAFLDRARRAVESLCRQLDDAALHAAVAAPTDNAVLISALRAAPDTTLVSAADPLAEARLEGLRISEQLLNHEGKPWSVQAVAAHLGITRQAVAKRAASHRLLAIDIGRHGHAYPAWQFVRGGVLPGLEATLDALDGHDAWMQLSFFLGASPRLDDRSPLEALRAGALDAVLQAARRFTQQGGA
jgi:hypothetical protein